MVEDELFVTVGVDVFAVELGIELGGNGDGLVGFCEMGKGDLKVGLFVAK